MAVIFPSVSQTTCGIAGGLSELKRGKEMVEQMKEHYEHFKNKISVCSVLMYCDCELHQTMDILCIQTHKGNKYALPGGKRDKQGVGRSEF